MFGTNPLNFFKFSFFIKVQKLILIDINIDLKLFLYSIFLYKSYSSCDLSGNINGNGLYLISLTIFFYF